MCPPSLFITPVTDVFCPCSLVHSFALSPSLFLLVQRYQASQGLRAVAAEVEVAQERVRPGQLASTRTQDRKTHDLEMPRTRTPLHACVSSGNYSAIERHSHPSKLKLLKKVSHRQLLRERVRERESEEARGKNTTTCTMLGHNAAIHLFTHG